VKEFVVYTLARIGLFVASYAVIAGVYLLLTGGDSLPLLWPLLLAAVVSAVSSYYMLRGQRERFAAVIQRRAEAAGRRLEESRAKEDRP
jgi:predicted Co/Zn/Cd cation transporter (cation efflux family)